MSGEPMRTDTASLAAYLSRIGTAIHVAAVVVVLGGAIVVADGPYPVLPTSYPTVLASGALFVAVGAWFDVKALEARLDARES